MGAAPSGAGPSAVDLHADIRELTARLALAVERADWLDAFLLAAGIVQAAEDRLQGVWGLPRRFVRHLDGRGQGDSPGPVAEALREVVDVSSATLLRMPPAHALWRWTAGLAAATEVLAQLVIGSLDPDRVPAEVYCELAHAARRLHSLPAARQVLGPAVVRPPSCFCSFDQHPEDVVSLVRRFTARFPGIGRPLVVLGIRTSGSYLAPLAAAALRQSGRSRLVVCTVRPGAGLPPALNAAVRQVIRAGGLALLLDDPPVTGRSIAQVAAWLERAGLPAAAVVPLLAVCEDEPVAPPLLRRYQSILLGGGDWEVRRQLAPPALSELVPRLVPGCREVLQVGVQGPLRRGAHLAVPVTARGDQGELALVAESAGLGYLGRRAQATARALDGLVPEVHGFAAAQGVLVRTRLRGERDTGVRSGPEPCEMARYVTERQLLLPAAADRSLRLTGRGPVWEVAAQVMAPFFGRVDPVLRPTVLNPLMRRLLAAPRPCVVDGRTMPWLWVRDGDNRWMKTDFAEGAFSHLDLASYDAVYDLAGAAVWLDRPDDELRRCFEDLNGERIPPARWCLLRLVQARNGRRTDTGTALPVGLGAAEVRRAQAKAVQGFLAEVFLSDLGDAPGTPDGAWCVLDIDGVLETDPLGFPAASPLGMLALRALRAHGYRTLLATGRPLPELRDRCHAYGLAGGVAEYGAVLYRADTTAVQPLVAKDWQKTDAELRRRLARLPDVTVDPWARWSVRASVTGSGRRGGLPSDAVARLLEGSSADGSEGLALSACYQVVAGDHQTDFVPGGADKACALRLLLAQLADGGGVPALAVGDGQSDLGMLRWAAHGWAPANAAPELRAAGVPVLRSAYQAGLAEAVAHLLGHVPGSCPECRLPAQSADTRALLALLAVPEAGARGRPWRLARLVGEEWLRPLIGPRHGGSGGTR